MKKYIAYGSNLNIEQMKRRCPTAKVYGNGTLEGWTVTFRSMRGPAYATIEPCPGGKVPVVIWDVDKGAEQALDIYEGFPHFYEKKNIDVLIENGKELTAMAYIMNSHSVPGKPSVEYINTISQGYLDNGLNLHFLGQFLERTCFIF